MKTALLTALAVASVALLAAAQAPPRPAPRTELMMVTGSESGTGVLVVLLYAWGGYQRFHQKVGLWHDRFR